MLFDTIKTDSLSDKPSLWHYQTCDYKHKLSLSEVRPITHCSKLDVMSKEPDKIVWNVYYAISKTGPVMSLSDLFACLPNYRSRSSSKQFLIVLSFCLEVDVMSNEPDAYWRFGKFPNLFSNRRPQSRKLQESGRHCLVPKWTECPKSLTNIVWLHKITYSIYPSLSTFQFQVSITMFLKGHNVQWTWPNLFSHGWFSSDSWWVADSKRKGTNLRGTLPVVIHFCHVRNSSGS